MSKNVRRYHCEFDNCACNKFKVSKHNLCFYCNHAGLWHARKERRIFHPMTSFTSSRQSASTPLYEILYVAQEIPVAKEVTYCMAIEVLPV